MAFKIKNIFVEYGLHKHDVALLQTVLRVFHLMDGILLFSLNDQIYFDNSVLF